MIKNLKRTLALAALMAGAGGAAHATEGWYGRADAGYSVGGDLDVDQATEAFDLENNWMGSVGLGYALHNSGFRFEGELAYRDNDLEENPPALTEGEVQATSLMFNAYYDFNRGGRYEPYVGIGVGAAQLEAQALFNGANDQFDEEDTVAAYQAMAGVAIGLSERLDLDIGYRYFVAPDAEFDGLQDSVVPTTYAADYTHQAVTVGLRYQFGAAAAPPPPPPPPAPPPAPPPPPQAVCPAADFVVYFEWDRSNLNQAALETIDAAVNRARQCNIGGIVVVGHTDTSGSTAYNAGLSERRAGVVREALVARGIATGSIRSEARGETDLARATRDGVREPLNRRTAVTISFR
ncbi:outer membrane beta-barrel protein [Terricaulis silvestris]|nr:outer membrane beta-barrel protein [Terricaulis silvestris]